MRKKNLSKFAAFTMAVVMMCGNVLTVMAEDPADTATGTTVEGTGKYEGKDGEKPIIRITLPTETQLNEVYNYIADPNDLLTKATDKGSLGSGATVNTNKGILFKTDTNTYDPTSKKFEVTSQNMQDVDVSVSVTVKEAGDSFIEYATTDTFEDTDKANKLYLALVNGETGDAAKSAALTASGVTLTQTAAGKTDNYELKYDSANSKYVYSAKADATDWNKVGFAMTGAINTKAEWGENVKFPKVQVTWSYKEHLDVPTVTETSISGTNNIIHFTLPSGVALKKVELVKSGSVTTLSSSSHYTIDETAGTITMVANVLSNNVGNKIKVYFDNDLETSVELTIVQ